MVSFLLDSRRCFILVACKLSALLFCFSLILPYSFGCLKGRIENRNYVKETVKETVKIEEGTYTVVTPVMGRDGNVTYKVFISTDGEIAAGKQGIVTGDTVYSYAKENTANKDLSNISDDAKDKIKENDLYSIRSFLPLTEENLTRKGGLIK